MITVPFKKIVDENGNTTPAFQVWVEEITNLQLLSGAGSPEGVVTADVNRLYRDLTGGASASLYIKNLSDIGGDKSQGWVLT